MIRNPSAVELQKLTTYHEKEILLGVAQGNEALFAELFHHYRNRIYTVAYHLTKSTTLAEEIVQDVFLKIWLRKEKLPEVADFASFLFIIARNQAYSCLRAVAREALKGKALQTWMPAANEETADAALLDKEFAGVLQEAIDRLPPQQKMVYVLSRQQGLKRDEIAAQLNLSPETVKAHLAQAVKNVRAYLLSRLPLLVMLALLQRW